MHVLYEARLSSRTSFSCGNLILAVPRRMSCTAMALSAQARVAVRNAGAPSSRREADAARHRPRVGCPATATILCRAISLTRAPTEKQTSRQQRTAARGCERITTGGCLLICMSAKWSWQQSMRALRCVHCDNLRGSVQSSMHCMLSTGHIMMLIALVCMQCIMRCRAQPTRSANRHWSIRAVRWALVKPSVQPSVQGD